MVSKGKLKRKTKRVNTKERVKAEKKVREHNRKVRRDKKRNPGKYAKSKKDPGVPNECPFKEDVLKEVEIAKQQKVAEKEKRREIAIQKRKEAKAKSLDEKRSLGLEGLVKDAQRKQQVHEAGKAVTEKLKNDGHTDRSAKAYYKEFQKVVEVADVVLQVLDARDPLGTRCKEVESFVLSNGKRLVLVLNKADLIPKENLESWTKYLRGELPAIAFKSSTQNQATKLGHSKIDIAKSTENQLQTSKCVGASTLMAMLGNYCRNKDIKTSIRVGVVGLPNVGKSSLINSLKRSKACSVGSTPGVTKAMQEVQLDSKVKLLDSPGVVLASGLKTDASVALRNAIRTDTMEDPITPIDAILQRCPQQQMCLQYNITTYTNVNEFLGLVARKLGKLTKGGIPNHDMAARIVLNDWNSGKIKYFTLPPETETKETHVSAEVVSTFAKEFSLENLDKMDQDDLSDLPAVKPSEEAFLAVGSSGMIETINQEEAIESMEEDSDEEIEDEENIGQLSKRVTFAAKSTNVKSKAGILKANGDKSDLPKFKAEGLLNLKKAAKMREKKEKKDRARRDVVATELSDNLENAFESLGNSDKYDFEKDFEIK